MEQSEAQIQNRAIQWAKNKFIKVIRMAMRSGVESGWPDCIFLIPGGMPVWVEFKAPGKKPTELQVFRMKYLENGGYHVYWFDNYEGCVDILEKHRQEGIERLHG